jgi:radical SAM protein with 4Fe4S-binding SPASM domain
MTQLESTGATDWNLCLTFACGRATGQSRYQLSGSELRTLVDFVHDRRERRGLAVRLAESCSYLSRLAGWESQRPFFCGAGLTRCAVMPNGDVVACGQVYEHGPSEGNIRLTPLPRIWKEGFADLRRNFQPAECRRCQHWHACQGGCWARRQMDAGCFKEIWTGSQGQDGHASRSL